MDEIKAFRDWVNTASRQPLEMGDMRNAIRQKIVEAKGIVPLHGPTVFPLYRDVYFRVAFAAMATIVVGLGMGYYGLMGMASEWSLHSTYYEVLGGLSSFLGVF